MIKISKLAKISAKKSFKILRKKSPIYCEELGKDVKITRIYFNHINNSDKKRKLKEVILRGLMVNLIDDILGLGKIFEIRKTEFFIYYELQLEIEGELFSAIISENKKTGTLILFSSFVK